MFSVISFVPTPIQLQVHPIYRYSSAHEGSKSDLIQPTRQPLTESIPSASASPTVVPICSHDGVLGAIFSSPEVRLAPYRLACATELLLHSHSYVYSRSHFKWMNLFGSWHRKLSHQIEQLADGFFWSYRLTLGTKGAAARSASDWQKRSLGERWQASCTNKVVWNYLSHGIQETRLSWTVPDEVSCIPDRDRLSTDQISFVMHKKRCAFIFFIFVYWNTEHNPSGRKENIGEKFFFQT